MLHDQSPEAAGNNNKKKKRRSNRKSKHISPASGSFMLYFLLLL